MPTAASSRYSGISLGFQIGAAIGDGLTTVIAAAVVALFTIWALSQAHVDPRKEL